MTFIDDLKRHVHAEVRSDAVSRSIYSVDASIYEVEPQAIIFPRHTEDILNTIKVASDHRIPLIPRGAATGITGGCLGTGVILDLSKHLNRILEINYDQEYAICEPGVIQNRLNEALKEHGYRLGPDTSTGDRATIGGMTANNAAGSRSLKYGKMVDHVLEVEMALSNGDLVTFGSPAPYSNHIQEICSRYKDEIKRRFPNIPRRVSGYNLDALLTNQNLAKLIVGSEGTLGIMTKIKVRIAKVPRKTSLWVLQYNDMQEGLHAIPKVLSYAPIAFEIIDDKIIAAGKLSPSMRGKLDWLKGNPQLVFAVEFEEETALDPHLGDTQLMLRDPLMQEHVWDIRKAGLGLLLSKRSYSRAIAFIEDITVSPHRLPAFMDRFLALLKTHGKEAGIYGHAGSGCLHIRPYIDLRNPAERNTMQTLMEKVTDLLLEHEGSLSGEHGDGLVRSWLTPQLYGDKIYQAFKEVKDVFDPLHLMNPGKIVEGRPFLENLRKGPSFEPKTFLDFSKEGGFALAADLCNGNALCRKKEKTMCPSFQATGDEYDSTRARAQTLRAIMNGTLPKEEWTGEGLHNVLDLCLQCKGCKTECPSQVDMAKMKAEFLYQYHEKHGVPIRDLMFGYIGNLNQIGSIVPGLSNGIIGTSIARKIQSLMGIAPERTLPTFATMKFSSWIKSHSPIPGRPVVLFNDTFTEFNCPEVGISAVKVLEALGYQVIVPQWKCCGRPLISKGLLKPAKRYAQTLIHSLLNYAKQQIPIIGLEPSCLLTIKDDYVGLLGSKDNDLETVISQSITFDEFIAKHDTDVFKKSHENIFVHGHCHQKALVGMTPTLDLLNRIGTAQEIPSGCCGMAGSFGYEKEHYDISMKIGELKLLPAARASNTAIIANGFSCRSQIEHGTGKRALHLSEFLSSFLD